MKTTMRLPILLLATLALSSCGYVRETFDIDRTGPDEYDVSVAAPLTIPPDFSLRPPTPGAERPQEIRAEDRAREALLGTAPTVSTAASASTSNVAPSTAESVLIDNTKNYASQPTPAGSIPQPEAMRALSNDAAVVAPAPAVEPPATPAPADAAAPQIEIEDAEEETSFWDSWF